MFKPFWQNHPHSWSICLVLAGHLQVYFWRECTCSYYATILDLVTVEDWGKGKFANPCTLSQPSISQASSYNPTLQDGSIKNLVY